VRDGFFYGQYELTIDEKNRLRIPAEILKTIDHKQDGEGFFVVIGLNLKPWIYNERRYQDMVSRTPNQMLPAEELLIYNEVNFAFANKLELDKQSRVLLPQQTLQLTQTKNVVTLFGAKDHLELWNRDEWEQHRTELLSQWKQVATRARQFTNQENRPANP
jgi:MraZ protein